MSIPSENRPFSEPSSQYVNQQAAKQSTTSTSKLANNLGRGYTSSIHLASSMHPHQVTLTANSDAERIKELGTGILKSKSETAHKKIGDLEQTINSKVTSIQQDITIHLDKFEQQEKINQSTVKSLGEDLLKLQNLDLKQDENEFKKVFTQGFYSTLIYFLLLLKFI